MPSEVVVIRKAYNFVDIDDKPIRFTDVRAVRLVKRRAVKENRSFANAVAVTIIERLGGADSNTIRSECQVKKDVSDDKKSQQG